MTDGWLAIISIVLWALAPFGIFIARHWIIAFISKGVQHQFDRQIEEVRSDFRVSEERLKSNLRDRESEIATLRSSVLAGSAGRQALLDKRRFEAVEKIWIAVNDLAQLKGLSGMMAVLNFKAMAKEAADPRMQNVLSILGAAVPDFQKLKNVARDERPFLPELAWAYFAAYRTILYGSFARFTVLKTGVNEADKFLTNDAAKKNSKSGPAASEQIYR
jgi:hypothetical protein